VKLVFLSDTHNKHNKLRIPECDILFHCGDWTGMGYKHEVERFAAWLDKQPARYIVVIPGNHEKTFEKCLDSEESSMNWFKDHCPRAHLLIHEAVEIEGIKIFGSPYTPYFFNWAWNAGRTMIEAAQVFKPFIGDLWNKIPSDTQILITHGPPYGILDFCPDWVQKDKLVSVGCAELLKRVQQLNKLEIHAFGHIHLKGGNIQEHGGVKFINAAICDESYNPTNSIIEINY